MIMIASGYPSALQTGANRVPRSCTWNAEYMLKTLPTTSCRRQVSSRLQEKPGGRNVRLDSATYGGYEVSLHYDPMIAKLCCWGRSRDSAIRTMIRALREFKILGIKTTIPFHRRVLTNPDFIAKETMIPRSSTLVSMLKT
jgi:biotin carboxylase